MIGHVGCKKFFEIKIYWVNIIEQITTHGKLTIMNE